MKVGLPARKLDRRYTYGDYRTWPEDERWELIRGVAWSMSPARKDMGEKTQVYEAGGVREYWIVDPGNRCGHVFRLKDGHYGDPVIHEEPGVVSSATLEGLAVRLEDLFRAAWDAMA